MRTKALFGLVLGLRLGFAEVMGSNGWGVGVCAATRCAAVVCRVPGVVPGSCLWNWFFEPVLLRGHTARASSRRALPNDPWHESDRRVRRGC